MFSSEEVLRFRSSKNNDEVVTKIKDCFEDLGEVSVSQNGIFSMIPASKYSGLLNNTEIDISFKCSSGEYKLVVFFKCSPTIIAWIIVGFGFLFCFFIGGCVALIPAYSAKNKIERDVKRVLGSLNFD